MPTDETVPKTFWVALPTVMTDLVAGLDPADVGGVHRRLHLVRAGADEVDRGRAGAGRRATDSGPGPGSGRGPGSGPAARPGRGRGSGPGGRTGSGAGRGARSGAGRPRAPDLLPDHVPDRGHRPGERSGDRRPGQVRGRRADLPLRDRDRGGVRRQLRARRPGRLVRGQLRLRGRERRLGRRHLAGQRGRVDRRQPLALADLLSGRDPDRRDLAGRREAEVLRVGGLDRPGRRDASAAGSRS